MEIKHIWQQNSYNPENANKLAKIKEWWAGLNGQKVHWQQRLLPKNGAVSEINWEPQQFDEQFVISDCQMRGITLYWQKPGADDERSMTPGKLELDSLPQILTIYPQSQGDLVVRVTLPEIKYQMLELSDPDIAVGKRVILLRDKQQEVEVKITLSPDKLAKLKQLLS
ncbi:MAG: hypothetical protein AB4352_13995 [Hormoscilla sp.]